VDCYSVNLREAAAFFATSDEGQIIQGLIGLGKPCFLRMGERGAALVSEGEMAFVPSVGVEESVDATGCGNCSTAASLIGIAEGLPPRQTVAMANISAAFNARQVGPWQDFGKEAKARAAEMLAKLM